MIEPRIVRRYASALLSAATGADVIDRVESDLGLVSYTLEMSPDLMETVKSPLIPVSTKRDILKDVFEDKVHPITLSYLYLVVDKHREDAILQTEKEFVLLANEARGIVDAHVTTAVELTEQERALLQSRLSEITGKRINLITEVAVSIIGGVVVRIGDRVVDGSVQGRLAALKEDLLS